MTASQEQVEELKHCFAGVQVGSEVDVPYYLIPAIALPPHCSPRIVDGLLCPLERDGYPSRLYYSHRVERPPRADPNKRLNWTGEVRILERNWHCLSWKIPGGTVLRLAQMVLTHLEAFS